MLQDGITLPDSAIATNFQIQHGTTLPTTGINEGEMFYLTALHGIRVAGLYVATGGVWLPAVSISATVAQTNTTQTFTKAQRGAILPLVAAATVLVDLAQSNNFRLVPGQNFTMGFPANAVPGQSGVIAITQDLTGGRTVTWAAGWVSAGGVRPVLSTAPSAVDYIAYYVETETRVFVAVPTLAVA